MMDELEKESRINRFVAEYLIDGNGRRSAIAAGWSPSSAAVTASRLLKLTAVKIALQKAHENSLLRLNVTRERVIAEYARVAFADIRNVIAFGHIGTYVATNEITGLPFEAVPLNGVKLIDSIGLPDEEAAAIAEVSQDAKGNVRVKMHSKMAALDALRGLLGLDNTAPKGDPLPVTDDGKEIDLENLDINQLRMLRGLINAATKSKDPEPDAGGESDSGEEPSRVH